ncbi:MAG: SCP2 sterol-binding domain-containing protein [Polyangiales bacterium]|nr:hypothetical protein [Myxococcales bacterium]
MSGLRSVELAPGADQNGFAVMISELVKQNVIDHPEKARDLARLRGRVAIVVEDARVAITLDCRGAGVDVHNGIVGIPDLTIRASSDEITRMSLIELLPRVGLPDPRGPVTREIAKASREGKIRVFGALANAPTMLRLTRLLSVN